MRVHAARALTTRPTVSVVVPCYNYGHYLGVAVASALDQPGLDVRVIVVDDASPDGSAAVAHELAAADPRVEVLVHPTNRGHIATYNDGLARADGDYVVLLSADDALMPGALTRAVALMEAHPDVAMTYGYAVDFTDEVPAGSDASGWWSTWTGEEWIALVARRGRNLVVNPEVVVRGRVMREIGGYDPVHPHAGDLEVWLRAAALGGVGRVNGTVQAAYRVHGANMHTTTYGALESDLTNVGAVFDTFLSPTGAGAGCRDAARLRARARRAIATQAVAAACRQGLPEEERQVLADLARRQWPGITRTLRWQLLSVSRSASRSARTARPAAVGHAVAEQVERVRWAVRWRRWRALGT